MTDSRLHFINLINPEGTVSLPSVDKTRGGKCPYGYGYRCPFSFDGTDLALMKELVCQEHQQHSLSLPTPVWMLLYDVKHILSWTFAKE